MLVDHRVRQTRVPPAQAFAPIQRIGGRQGWFYANFLWKLRGYIDLLFGGPGLRPGRRHPDRLSVNDALDWWRVEAFEPGRLLRLRAEMKIPGRAWLEFTVKPGPHGGSEISQTASFEPGGLWGYLYWYAMWPFHQVLFPGMLRNIVKTAERESAPSVIG